MGWRFQRRKKILPGVTLNLGKKSIGYTLRLGPFSFSNNSRGRSTLTTRTGVPGLHHSKNLSSSRQQDSKAGSNQSAKGVSCNLARGRQQGLGGVSSNNAINRSLIRFGMFSVSELVVGIQRFLCRSDVMFFVGLSGLICLATLSWEEAAAPPAVTDSISTGGNANVDQLQDSVIDLSSSPLSGIDHNETQETTGGTQDSQLGEGLRSLNPAEFVERPTEQIEEALELDERSRLLKQYLNLCQERDQLAQDSMLKTGPSRLWRSRDGVHSFSGSLVFSTLDLELQPTVVLRKREGDANINVDPYELCDLDIAFIREWQESESQERTGFGRLRQVMIELKSINDQLIAVSEK